MIMACGCKANKSGNEQPAAVQQVNKVVGGAIEEKPKRDNIATPSKKKVIIRRPI